VWYKYVQRASAKTAQKLYNTSFKGNGELTEALEAHSMYIEELLDLHPSKRKEIADIVEDSYDSILNDTNIIQFGIQQLDYFAGGMTRKEITVLGGRPGHGKSTLVINIIRKLIEQGNKVVIFNREMSNEEMMKKILVMESQFLTSGDIRRHTLSDIQNKELEKMKSDITEKYENLIMFDNISGLAEAIREISRIKPDIVIDDYIQLVQLEDDKMERRFQLEKIMHQYKWSAKKNNCHAILVSQLNREIERRLDPRPKMSDFAESGVIEQTAESAMFVFYGWNFNPKTYDENQCEIIFAKSRYGKQGAIDMGFNGNKCTYYENIGDASS
jgi:replicative DNA helicase